MISFLLSLVLLIVGYFTYGKFVDKTFGTNDSIETPAESMADGVPTVVDAATIANDAMDLVLDEMINQADAGKEFYNILNNIDKNEKGMMIKSLLDPYVGDLMVTPKEIDDIIESVSKIIANGINIALQPNMVLEDINKFLN